MSKVETIVEITASDKFKDSTRNIEDDIKQAYLENDAPWIICFSGGKDSTALLQLVFYSLSELPKGNLTKEMHVLSNDTLVENPSIGKYIDEQLDKIKVYGKEKLYGHNPGSFFVEKGKPEVEDRFWFNLIGKGYPSPNRWFRWCTDRLKINPTSNYIEDSLKTHEKVIIILGTRKAESSNRAVSMKKYDNNGRFRNHTLPNALVYAPIADLSNNDVWAYLLQTPNPWGSDNMDLLAIYGHACSGGECPFVIETGTQSCGKSRFGCWVCTVVERDRSMENFINNGDIWMEDLLDFRNWLYEIRQESSQYVPARLIGKAKFGPFLLRTREEMLEKLIQLQEQLGIELISEEELSITKKLIEGDKKARYKNGMARFVYEMSNGERIAVISDCNVAEINRKRLGSIHLKRLKLLKSEIVTNKYEQSKRAMYYKVSS